MMRIYLTNTGKLELLYMMKESSGKLGNMLIANNFRIPKQYTHYAVDNGAFSAYLNKTNFDGKKFLKTVNRLNEFKKPDFIVVPDIVAGGMKSFDFSMFWLHKLLSEGHTNYDYYFAVQDFMNLKVISKISNEKINGIFIGGTLKWKLKHGEQFTKEAHDFDLKVHIGRVGNYKNLVWANRIKADSTDSSTINRNNKIWLLEDFKKQSTLL
jgi:hypothetical protein